MGAATKARALAKPYKQGPYEKLSPQRRNFVDEYMLDLNAWQAAIRAGYVGGSSYDLLRQPAIIDAINERRAGLDGERNIQGAKYVVNKLWEIESADPRELTAIWKTPCRYCYGVNSKYQFTKVEMDRRIQAHQYGKDNQPFEALWPRGGIEHAAWIAGKSNMALDPQGGDGYTTKKEPNPDCVECGGDGLTIQHVADTRKLSPGARALYRGVKATKDGFEILMADQAQARDQLAKHYGVATERKRLLVRKLDPDELSDEELAQSIAELETLTATDADYEIVEEPDIPAAQMPPPKRVRSKARYRKPKQQLITRPS
jgi:phage terminase small subunit